MNLHSGTKEDALPLQRDEQTLSQILFSVMEVTSRTDGVLITQGSRNDQEGSVVGDGLSAI